MSTHSEKPSARSESLPRSLFAPQSDPRGDLREMVNAVFSDRFMIFLSLIVVPLILVPLIFDLDASVLVFFEICDWFIVILFVAEYTTKLYAAQNRWTHFKSAWHLVDLVIIALPFIQYLPLLQIPITGSPSLLLRLLRLPRALAIGGRAVAGRRGGNSVASNLEAVAPQTVIRAMGSDLAGVSTMSWGDLKAHVADVNRQEWLDIRGVSDAGFVELSRALGVSELHFKSGLVDDIYPHIDYVSKGSFIFVQSGKVRYPEHADAYLTINRSGLIVVCSGSKIITVSRHTIDLFEKLLPSLRVREDDGFVVSVLHSLLDYTLADYRSVLSEVELEVLKISGTHRSKLPKDFLERAYQLDKEISRLVSNLLHFKDMLGIITSKKVPLAGFNEEWLEVFGVLGERAEYLNEIAHELVENLRGIIDLYINQTSFETNRILKILAVITAISVIPSAVSGILGTNLLDVPYGATLWELSFVITVVMAFVAYTFVRLGWLKT